MNSTPFRVGVSRDLSSWNGGGVTAIGLDLLEAADGVDWRFLEEDSEDLSAELIAGYDALFVERPRIDASALTGNERLAIIARFGVGYEKIDVAACTAKGIVVTIARDAVRRPVAVSALTLLLSASQNLVRLDALTRQGRWHEREQTLGLGLVERTVGVIGLGNIGQELFKLLEPFDVRRVAYDPYIDSAAAHAVSAQLVDLPTLCAISDFLVVLCPLTPETHHLVDVQMIERMKPTAFLINVARGAIVDQRALTEALRTRRIRGAGLDVLEQEPVDSLDPLLALDSVIVTPHYLCSTDQCLRDCGREACESILAVAAGRIPDAIVDPEALAHDRWANRLSGLNRS